MSQTTDRGDDASATRRSPSMSDIEGDIRDIRARMDATLDEIEFRLSPGQMSGIAVDVVRDVVQGNPTRIARAIRRNPIPLALMGIGALWLAWSVSRTPAVDNGEERLPISDQRARILLTGLVGACRQGADACRAADAAIGTAPVSTHLSAVSEELERAAAALERELHRRGGMADPTAPEHPAWRDLHAALRGDRSRATLLTALERGLDGVMAVFHDALHEDLPPDLRVAVGARFHDLERVQHDVGALREAVA